MAAAIVVAAANTLMADDLQDVAERHEQKKSEYVDGVKMYRPFLSDEQMVVSDFVDVNGLSKEKVFTNALLYIVETMDPETETIEAFDVKEGTFILVKQYKSVSEKNTIIAKKDDVIYSCKIAFKATDGALSFRMYDIVSSYKDIGVVSKKADLRSLLESKKDRQKEMAEKFLFFNSSYIRDIAEGIARDKAQKVTHWNTIAESDVVKGMNETEVKLAVGLPESIREQNGKVTWMISYSFIVIFKDGVVVRVVK